MGFRRSKTVPKEQVDGASKLFATGSIVAVGTAVVRYSPLTVMPVGALMIGWGLSRLSRQLVARVARV